MNVSALYGQASVALMIGAALSFAPVSFGRRLGWVGAAAAFLFLRHRLFDLFDQPSITLTLLVSAKLVFGNSTPAWSGRGAGVLVAVGVIFYPLAFGLGPINPYGYGYAPAELLLLPALIAVWLAFHGETGCLVLLACSLLAYAAGLFDNLWNAVFDPILFSAAVVFLLKRVLLGKDVPSVSARRASGEPAI